MTEKLVARLMLGRGSQTSEPNQQHVRTMPNQVQPNICLESDKNGRRMTNKRIKYISGLPEKARKGSETIGCKTKRSDALDTPQRRLRTVRICRDGLEPSGTPKTVRDMQGSLRPSEICRGSLRESHCFPETSR